MADELRSINENIKELVTGLKGNLEKVGAKVSSEIGDVMSEEMQMTVDTLKQGWDIAKDSSVKLIDFFKNTVKASMWNFKFIRHDRKQTEALESIATDTHRMWIMRLLSVQGMKKAGMGLLGVLGAPLLAIAALTGAWAKKLIFPFQVIGKIINWLVPMASIWIKEAKWFKKGMTGFKKFAKVFRWLGKIPGMKFIFRAMRFGFKKLFWPIQIIMSLIDFISGYMATEGTILEKIQSGIKNVIMKFFEFPIQLLGGLIERITGFVGIEMKKGSATEFIMRKFGDWIHIWFGSLEFIFKNLYDAGVWISEELKKIDWNKVWEWIQTFIKAIVDVPENIKRGVTNLWRRITGRKPLPEEPLIETAGRPAEAEMGQVFKDQLSKAEEQKQIAKEQRDLQKQTVKALDNYAKEVVDSIKGIPIMIGNAASELIKPIPEETREMFMEAYGWFGD